MACHFIADLIRDLSLLLHILHNEGVSPLRGLYILVVTPSTGVNTPAYALAPYGLIMSLRISTST